MGQLLHRSAKTTEVVRRAIQNSQASVTQLAACYDLNVKTVTKWKNRDFVPDEPMGPKERHSTVLSLQEEAIIVAFRKHTLLPLDDCLYALQSTIGQRTSRPVASIASSCQKLYTCEIMANAGKSKPFSA